MLNRHGKSSFCIKTCLLRKDRPFRCLAIPRTFGSNEDNACVRGFPVVPTVYQYRSRFYQGTIGYTFGTNGTIGSPNGTVGRMGKAMVPLATNGYHCENPERSLYT